MPTSTRRASAPTALKNIAGREWSMWASTILTARLSEEKSMRFASYVRNGQASFGIVVGDEVVDCGGDAATLRAAIAEGRLGEIARSAQGRFASARLDAVQLLPVIPDPPRIFCVGLNYESHRSEMGRQVVGHPTIFVRFPESLGPAGGEIVRPRESVQLDYEGELAVIIGKGGRRIAEADAWGHIAGYAPFNDASVRDWQNHTHQYTPGKNFPTTGPFGPFLVTPDEVGEIGPQTIETRLNGETVQSAHLDQMIFKIPTIIAYLSTFTPLQPGDVIATGTPGGVGARREPPLWMKPGDTVEVEIEGVGLLRSRVVADEGA